MKNKSLLLIILITALTFSCKQKNTKEKVEDIIEEENVAKKPNISDLQFKLAISLLDEQKGKEAAVYLNKGVEELKNEGKDVGGLYKVNLDGAIAKLTNMSSDLENGINVSEEAVREAIANAEINIAHDYLSTSDIYVLEEPNNVVSSKIRKNFNKALNNMKNEEGKMKEESKKAGEALLNEGNKLDEEYKNWEQKAKEYSEKTNQHFNTYYKKIDVPSGE